MEGKAPKRTRTRQLLDELAELPKELRIADPRTAEVLRRWDKTIRIAAEHYSAIFRLDPEDTLQEAYMGCLKAVRTWPKGCTTRLNRVFLCGIRQHVSRHNGRCAVEHRPKSHVRPDLKRLREAENIFYLQYGYKPTPAWLSERTGLSKEVLKRAHPFHTDPNRESPPIKGQHVSKPRDNPLNILIRREGLPLENLEKILGEVDYRAARIIKLSYGLEGVRDPMKLKEIGEDIGGVSRERVRQIRIGAEWKLRRAVIVGLDVEQASL